MTATLRQPRKTLPGVITKPAWLSPMVCIYGDAGIGKSTFGASAPNPVFVPTEAGVENLDVARFPVAETLDDFLGNLAMVANGEHDHGAVVIDTLNNLMSLFHKAKKDIIGDKGRPLYDFVGFGGYSGWNAVAQDWKHDVFPLLKKCQARGMYVIILGHAGTYTDKTSQYDVVKAGASINKNVWKTVLGDMDVVGKAEYVFSVRREVEFRDRKTGASHSKIFADTDAEIIDGVKVKRRRLVFEGGMEVDAKTRIGYELPPEMPLSWDEFAARLGNVKALAAEVRDLWRHIDADKVDATLKYLGIDDPARLEEANRSRLSIIRNRLLEVREAAREESNQPVAYDADGNISGDQAGGGNVRAE